MRWNVSLDLASTQEWGLNVQQGVVFAYIYSCPSWADKSPDDPDFFNISNGKIASDLSIISTKRDTILRYVLQLVDAGLLERRTIKRNQYLKLTDKAKGWYRQRDINPASVEQRDNNPSATGYLSREQRDNSPENKITTSISKLDKEKISKKTPPAFVKMVTDLHKKILPELESVVLWGDDQTRAKHLNKIWLNSEIDTHDPSFWEAYFGFVRTNDWWMGRSTTSDGKPFKASFEFLVNPKQFVRIVEGCLNQESGATHVA